MEVVVVDREARETRFDRELEQLGIRIRDTDQLKVRENVFDEVTLLALYRLAHKKWITSVGGSVSTGKEANVFTGMRDTQEIAIKIYRIRTANFNAMSSYIVGDRRFSKIGHSKKDIVFTWTQKEFANLLRAHEVGVPVPKPLVWDRNILIMEFLGMGGIAYPHLRNADVEEPCEVYHQILSYVSILYKKAGLVHADLSEFNILYHDRPFLIDMGQS
ncbi:MAG: serine protein kinase RIO, partial [Methanoregulaceae archaeon]|nr:serine protein kinase RIO [Methanoregulaceae archaeon]